MRLLAAGARSTFAQMDGLSVGYSQLAAELTPLVHALIVDNADPAGFDAARLLQELQFDAGVSSPCNTTRERTAAVTTHIQNPRTRNATRPRSYCSSSQALSRRASARRCVESWTLLILKPRWVLLCCLCADSPSKCDRG